MPGKLGGNSPAYAGLPMQPPQQQQQLQQRQFVDGYIEKVGRGYPPVGNDWYDEYCEPPPVLPPRARMGHPPGHLPGPNVIKLFLRT